jgi:hypothetical protein
MPSPAAPFGFDGNSVIVLYFTSRGPRERDPKASRRTNPPAQYALILFAIYRCKSYQMIARAKPFAHFSLVLRFRLIIVDAFAPPLPVANALTIAALLLAQPQWFSQGSGIAPKLNRPS